MPGPPVTPVQSDTSLPDRVDVVVIGGGIIGASTALELVERGHSVLLCEKGQIGAEQSSRNWGWVRISLRDPREIPLMMASTGIWEGLETRISHKTGYAKTGILWPAYTDRTEGEYQRWAKHLTSRGIDCPMLTPAQMDDLMPGHQMKIRAGMFAPSDGRAEPQWVTSGIALAARAKGCAIMTNCAVRSLDMGAGQIAGVITEHGAVACDAVVVAGGAWSRLFAGNAGVYLPQLKVRSSVMRTSPVEGGPDVTLHGQGFALRKHHDGGYTVVAGTGSIVDLVPDTLRLSRAFLPALRKEYNKLKIRLNRRWLTEARTPRRWSGDEVTPFEQCRTLDPNPDEPALARGWADARRAFPALEGADIVQTWAGMIDVTPDALPVISPVDDVPGLHIATGFSGHGFGIGPAAGRLMADLVTGAVPVVDPTDFRLSRFTDGTRVRPESGY